MQTCLFRSNRSADARELSARETIATETIAHVIYNNEPASADLELDGLGQEIGLVPMIGARRPIPPSAERPRSLPPHVADAPMHQACCGLVARDMTIAGYGRDNPRAGANKMSHRSEALSALDDIERAARSLRARLGELQAPQADQVERAAAVVEVSRTLRRRADDLHLSVASEALELGVAAGVLGWNLD